MVYGSSRLNIIFGQLFATTNSVEDPKNGSFMMKIRSPNENMK